MSESLVVMPGSAVMTEPMAGAYFFDAVLGST
jgi:hypothetical protein